MLPNCSQWHSTLSPRLTLGTSVLSVITSDRARCVFLKTQVQVQDFRDVQTLVPHLYSHCKQIRFAPKCAPFQYTSGTRTSNFSPTNNAVIKSKVNIALIYLSIQPLGLRNPFNRTQSQLLWETSYYVVINARRLFVLMTLPWYLLIQLSELEPCGMNELVEGTTPQSWFEPVVFQSMGATTPLLLYNIKRPPECATAVSQPAICVACLPRQVCRTSSCLFRTTSYHFHPSAVRI